MGLCNTADDLLDRPAVQVCAPITSEGSHDNIGRLRSFTLVLQPVASSTSSPCKNRLHPVDVPLPQTPKQKFVIKCCKRYVLCAQLETNPQNYERLVEAMSTAGSRLLLGELFALNRNKTGLLPRSLGAAAATSKDVDLRG